MIDASTIAFVINPKSHRVAKKGSWLKQAAARTNGIEEVFFTDPENLKEDLSKCAKRGVCTIFIEGGDGTVLAVLSVCQEFADLFHQPPQFAILPGGSTNLAYKILGYKARNADAFQSRLAAVLKGVIGSEVLQPALKVEGDGLALSQLGFVLSTGTLARAMRYVQTEFHSDGHRGSFAVGQAIFRFLRAPQAYLDHDGEPVVRGTALNLRSADVSYNQAHCLAIMTPLSKLSLGLYPFWGNGNGGIALTYAKWPLPHFRRGLFQALFWKRSASLERMGFFSHQIDELYLESDGQIMIDGESFDLGKDSCVRVTLSKPLRFLR